MRFAVAIDVMPKHQISDPQGQTIERALPGRGYAGISGVRVGKRIAFEIEAEDETSARQVVESACQRFLTNPIIEDFEVHITAGATA